MSIFYKALEDIMKPGMSHGQRVNIIKAHLRKLSVEYNLDNNVREELQVYQKHLLNALSAIEHLPPTHERYTLSVLKPHIDAATVLVRDIQRKLKSEFRESRRHLL